MNNKDSTNFIQDLNKWKTFLRKPSISGLRGIDWYDLTFNSQTQSIVVGLLAEIHVQIHSNGSIWDIEETTVSLASKTFADIIRWAIEVKVWDEKELVYTRKWEGWHQVITMNLLLIKCSFKTWTGSLLWWLHMHFNGFKLCEV